MKLLVYFLYFFTLLSCVSEMESSSNVGLEGDAQSSSDQTEANQPEVSNKRRKSKYKKDINSLSEEEKYLKKARRAERKGLDDTLGFVGFQKEDKNNNVICRRFQGCRRFCSDIYQQNKDCNQWPVKVVLQSWSNRLKKYDIRQLVEHAEWMGRYRDVVGFLHAADLSHSVFRYITHRISERGCEFSGDIKLNYEVHGNSQSSSSALYVLSKEDDAQNMKKIMDSTLFYFDAPLFRGMLNKCLYYSGLEESEENSSPEDSSIAVTDKPLSLMEYMVAYNNEIGFSIAHQILAQSCGDKNDCIQLAYCTLGSEAVWSYLDKNRYQFGLDIRAQSSLCSYEDFHSLPSKGLITLSQAAIDKTSFAQEDKPETLD